MPHRYIKNFDSSFLVEANKTVFESWVSVCFLIALIYTLSGKVTALELPFMNEGIPYSIALKDVDSAGEYKELIELIKDGITLQRAENLTLKKYTEPTKIVRFEQDIIRRILRSQGYYRFFVNAVIEKSSFDVTNSKISQAKKNEVERIIYQLTPGSRYKVAELQFNLDKDINLEQLGPLPIKQGNPLIAEDILSTQKEIRSFIRAHYCYYEVKVDYQVLIDHQAAQAKVIYSMIPSQQTKFGPIFIEGLESVDYHYLMSFIKYKEDQCFQRDKIDSSRLSVLRSNLISNVIIEIGKIENSQVITRYKVNERHHRTIKTGIGYSTDEGAYLSAGWEHRNIHGAGEKLEFNTRFSSLRQKLSAQFYIPNFYQENKSLTLYSEAINEELDAYEALSLKIGTKIGFKRTDFLNYYMGAELKASDVVDQGQQEEFYLASFPFEIEWDHTNSILDPTDGFLVTAEIRPYVGVINTDTKFYKTMLSVSAYHTFDLALQPTIAARYSAGTITGESVNNIPADERFYVGGGGSVRGYPYQSLSILNEDDPEGGASFQQVNTELRIRFLDNWGLATFVGGGFAFEEATPNFNQKLLWAAGLGLRYYTLFAPFRADIALPLNRRKSYDDNFQLYISIGQAF
jgi:translocation and assembly module TamA